MATEGSVKTVAGVIAAKRARRAARDALPPALRRELQRAHENNRKVNKGHADYISRRDLVAICRAHGCMMSHERIGQIMEDIRAKDSR